MNSESDQCAAHGTPQQILLVTGLLGAGKTTVLRELEDLGWEMIDNFPIRLLDRLIDNTTPRDNDIRGPIAIGFDSRTRGFNPQSVIRQAKEMTERDDIELTTLFLDCSSKELERRYNETRRRHPLASDMPASTGIRAERELLEPLRRWADMLIETTDLSANDLRKLAREKFASASDQAMTVSVSSFGFSRGMPPVADLVFDMRFLDNPHWVDELRPLTGIDEAVGDHIRKDPAFAEAFERICGLLQMLLPRYHSQGKSYVHIAFGCTGGRHRSVFTAEQVATVLRDSGFSPTLLHRNLDSRAADLLEGGAGQ
ncbi:MAG: RNase adapter RapZ [Novosphingobium sp.]|nr:RNase adapter RapZ [Novosphingobium sp.]